MSMMEKAQARGLRNVTLFDPTREWLATDRFGGKHIWLPVAKRWARLLVRRASRAQPIKRKRYAGHHDDARSTSV